MLHNLEKGDCPTAVVWTCSAVKIYSNRNGEFIELSDKLKINK